jgi:hypothetical protein
LALALLDERALGGDLVAEVAEQDAGEQRGAGGEGDQALVAAGGMSPPVWPPMMPALGSKPPPPSPPKGVPSSLTWS